MNAKEFKVWTVGDVFLANAIGFFLQASANCDYTQTAIIILCKPLDVS